MNFASVTADLPTHDDSQRTEIMFYVTRVAYPLFSKGVSEFESQLLYNVRARFGNDIEILYLDMHGEACDLRFANRVRIHLVQSKPTVH